MSMRNLKIIKSITNRESLALEKYLKEIDKLAMITPEEEVILAQKIKKGDQAALDKLVKANLRFAVSVAKQYQHQGLSLSDLINEANLGLIKAGKRFDETRGFKFISYAVGWVRQSILQALADQGRLVRIPNNRIISHNKVNKIYNHLEQKLEREPSLDELTEESGLKTHDMELILQLTNKHSSLDAPIFEDGETTAGDLMSGVVSKVDGVLSKESLDEDIERALGTLLAEQRTVVKMYFGIGCDPMTIENIGDAISRTGERARQMLRSGIHRLRRTQTKSLLKKYMG